MLRQGLKSLVLDPQAITVMTALIILMANTQVWSVALSALACLPWWWCEHCSLHCWDGVGDTAALRDNLSIWSGPSRRRRGGGDKKPG
ncbi:hypothetical protein ElyMa_006533300 [Elysia marginata]|uniref:Uncharacterized protein n=1 Tax=Elysia marginata TaxID=1093978 RepID=A0AAV4I6F4_9GAST|nr:hypothetical protein ElyMa_006533300 [Elysia marginata]